MCGHIFPFTRLLGTCSQACSTQSGIQRVLLPAACLSPRIPLLPVFSAQAILQHVICPLPTIAASATAGIP